MIPICKQALLYEDGVLLKADSKNKLQEAVIEWNEILRSKRMVKNVKKSRIIQMGRTVKEIESVNFTCYEKELGQVLCYEYLTTIIWQNRKISKKSQIGRRKVLININK